MKPRPGSRYPSIRTGRAALRSLVLALAAPVSLAQEAPPIADFTTNPSPATGEERVLVQFLDRSLGTVTAWSWDFGDGSGSTLQNPLHLFLFGKFDVTLTVTGPGGSSSFTLHEAVEVSAEPPTALATMPIPMPAELGSFVADIDRAVELGKALFWDVQLGSDGMTACASCHYHAGVDNRPRNTLNPGANGVFEPTHSGRGGGPNTALNSGDFPFTKWLDPMDGLELLATTDDVRGATGMFKSEFLGLDAGSPSDLKNDLDDGLFHVNGTDTLQVTGRDAPTTIGAIFFHRLFWDGRANHFFNGRNIWGNADPSRPPVLERLPDGSLGEISILLDNAAAASQAIGPPLSDVEMSWAGRSWPDLGRKMIPRRPLANQLVDPTDGVLGGFAHVPGPGLTPGLTYADMIRSAFLPRWWASIDDTADGFSQMEANFALFFGLAVQCYEATLIPDQAPFDRYRMGDRAAMSDSALEGLSFFLGPGKCITCHDSPLFAGGLRSEVINNEPEEGEGIIERMFMQNAVASTTVIFATNPRTGELPLTFNPYRKAVSLYSQEPRLLLATTNLPSGQRCPDAGVTDFALSPTNQVASTSRFHGNVRIEADGNCNFRITVSFDWNSAGPSFYWYDLEIGGETFELLIAPASAQAVYDNGFYNIGVRPSTEDLGVGGNGPFGPLSIARRVQNGEDVGQETRGGPVSPTERVAVNGAFKTPTLRNVELTGPYMHNGSMATLEQVVEFYSRATDFGEVNYRDKDIDVSGFDMTEQQKADVVAFLKSLTDPRVRHERAPFDHPQLPLKAGHQGDSQAVGADGLGNGLLAIEFRQATGADGGPAIPAFIDRLAASITVAVVGETTRSARVALICDKPPAAPVRVRLKASDESLASLSVGEVVFTPADWRVTRFVEIERIPDGTFPLPVTIRTSNAQSADPEFARLEVRDLLIDFDPSTSSIQQDSVRPPEPETSTSRQPVGMR